MSETNGHLTYRFLLPEEWHRLHAIYPSDQPLPHPLAASAVVAERGDEIVGVLFLQVCLHMEPLILTDPHINYQRMVSLFTDAVSGKFPFYALAPNRHIADMAAAAGMRPLEGVLYVRED